MTNGNGIVTPILCRVSHGTFTYGYGTGLVTMVDGRCTIAHSDGAVLKCLGTMTQSQTGIAFSKAVAAHCGRKICQRQSIHAGSQRIIAFRAIVIVITANDTTIINAVIMGFNRCQTGL